MESCVFLILYILLTCLLLRQNLSSLAYVSIEKQTSCFHTARCQVVIVFGQLKRRVFWWNNSLPFRPLWWGQGSANWLPKRKKGQTKLISNPNSQIPQQYRIQLPFREFVRSRGLNNCAMYFLLFNWGGQIRLCPWFMDDWGSTCLRGWLGKVSRFAEDYQVLFCFWNGLRHQGCEFTGWRWCPWCSTLFSFCPKWVHPPIPQVACVMNGFLLDHHQAIGVSNWPHLDHACKIFGACGSFAALHVQAHGKSPSENGKSSLCHFSNV